MLDECHAGGVAVEVGTAVHSVGHEDRRRLRVETSRGPVDATSLVVATGGLSIPLMGATGFGYDLARQFGHGIVPTRAALVPLTLPEPERSEYGALAGVSLPAKVSCGKKSFAPGFLFTHRGLSGPSILQISSYWQPGDAIMVDWLAGRDLRGFLRERRRERPTTELKNVLGEILPKRLAQVLCELLSEVPGEWSGGERPGDGAFGNRQVRLFRTPRSRRWPSGSSAGPSSPTAAKAGARPR